MRVLALVLASVVLSFGMKGDGDVRPVPDVRQSELVVVLQHEVSAARATLDAQTLAVGTLDVRVSGRSEIQEGMGGGSPLPAPRAELGAGGKATQAGIDDGAAAARSGFSLTVRQLARDGPPPTIEPLPTPTATAVALSIPELICKQSWPCDQALRVAQCESGMNPDAYNRGSGASGLYQVVPYWHSWRLRAGESLFDATVNIRVAHDIWSEQGWLAWSCQP